MNSDFPRILSLLRKERGISQKQAAASLNISQALLSHYEKGIRECGLDFVVRAADFYGVSCDYLLGRSPERNGATLSVKDIPEGESVGKDNRMQGNQSILPTLNKKLLTNSLNVLYDLLGKLNSKEMTTMVSDFLMLSIYRMFRCLYNGNRKNEQDFFTVPKSLYSAKSLAMMAEIEAEANLLTDEALSKKGLSEESRMALSITSESLSENYPKSATSLFNLIKNSEKKLERLSK